MDEVEEFEYLLTGNRPDLSQMKVEIRAWMDKEYPRAKPDVLDLAVDLLVRDGTLESVWLRRCQPKNEQ